MIDAHYAHIISVLDCVAFFLPHMPLLVRFVGYAAHGGFTSAISLVLDALRILALPVTFCHLVLTSVFAFETRTLRSLWNLFRGECRTQR